MINAYQPSLIEDLAGYTPDPLSLERYESAGWMIDDLIDNLPFHLAGTVLECCAGSGNLVEPLRRHGLKVITNEIDMRLPADLHFDATDPRAEWPAVDYVITNPPFSRAVPILLNMINRARLGVIFQLPIYFSEPTEERDNLFRAYKPNGQITMMRYSFTGDGGKNLTTTVWLTWLTGYPPLFPPMREGKKLVQSGKERTTSWPGYATFRKDAEFFRIARRHV